VTQLTGQKLKRSYRSKSVYDDLLELWGGLKAADSPASAGVKPTADRTLPGPSHVGEYIDTELSPPDDPETLSERLNYKREQTRKQTLDTLADRVATSDNSNPDAASGQIYTLTLPTGAGKTLTGTQAALHLHDVMGNTGPLLYILPYTSIIDQTESVYADLFGFNASSDGPTPTVGVDHYLADSTDEDDTELDTKKTAGNMAVTPLWHNDITLSTTVQLWETLCGPSKSQVLKLPQLYESTIIIDEPQSLPTEWFGRVEELLETLRDVFHANVILMSATQPPISYPPKSLNREAQELSPDDIEMPDNTTVTIDRSVVTDDTLSDQSVAETLADDVVSGSNSVLSIHNTINNTNRVSNTLKHELSNCGVEHKSLHTIYDDLIDPGAQKIESLSDIDVYDPLPSVTEIVDAVSKAEIDTLTVTLTTRHRPCDRSRILDALTALLSRQTQCEATDIPQIIALTTQLVEAGVDISFESLYRDLAPYESLIQAAGRCNREYEYGVASGDMTIWHLADNDGGPGTPAEYVYQTGGANRLYLTAKTLSTIAGGGEQITEQRLIEDYEDYKQALEPKLSFPTDGLTNVNGRKLTRASVIPDDGQSVSICIARTPTESRLIEAYHEAAEYNQRSQTAIRDTLSHIECSVRVDDDTNITDIAHKIDDTLYLVDNDQADTAYSKVGLTTQIDDTVSHRFH
jgi:CRISPR-associated endonuclease/helicase Cas3/CRISPR-associated endonuclease Cas3-HD